MRYAALAMFLTALPAAAEDLPRVQEILDAARAECAAMSGGGAVAVMTIGPAAVTHTDLDGDGVRDDAVVDFNHLSCSLALTLWGGTGGAPVHFVPADQPSQSWTGWGWQVVEFNGRPLILLARHGVACDSFGASPCVQAISLFEDGFQTIRFPASDEESAAAGDQ